MRRALLAIASAAALLAGLPGARAEVLITKAEAELPTPAGVIVAHAGSRAAPASSSFRQARTRAWRRRCRC